MKEFIKNVQKWFSDQKTKIMQHPFKSGLAIGGIGTMVLVLIMLLMFAV